MALAPELSMLNNCRHLTRPPSLLSTVVTPPRRAADGKDRAVPRDTFSFTLNEEATLCQRAGRTPPDRCGFHLGHKVCDDAVSRRTV